MWTAVGPLWVRRRLLRVCSTVLNSHEFWERVTSVKIDRSRLKCFMMTSAIRELEVLYWWITLIQYLSPWGVLKPMVLSNQRSSSLVVFVTPAKMMSTCDGKGASNVAFVVAW
jgi:hypothetical protein